MPNSNNYSVPQILNNVYSSNNNALYATYDTTLTYISGGIYHQDYQGLGSGSAEAASGLNASHMHSYIDVSDYDDLQYIFTVQGVAGGAITLATIGLTPSFDGTNIFGGIGSPGTFANMITDISFTTTTAVIINLSRTMGASFNEKTSVSPVVVCYGGLIPPYIKARFRIESGTSTYMISVVWQLRGRKRNE
jgi:hypothetical protein